MGSPAPVTIGQAEPPPDQGETRPRRVMLVDDEVCILRSLTRLLRNEPYELITANSPTEALELLSLQPVDLIISDQRMPEMCGTELLKRVCQQWPHTIRIILSGYSEVSSILNAVNEGAIYKYLTKPWNDEELKLNIRRAVEQVALIDQNQSLLRRIEEQNHQLVAANEQLHQRATDAMFGLSFTRELLNTISAGVIGVDTDGMVVGTNDRAAELLGVGFTELHGAQAEHVLPQELLGVLETHEASGTDEYCTEIALSDGPVQVCTRDLIVDKAKRGRVLTVWRSRNVPR